MVDNQVRLSLNMGMHYLRSMALCNSCFKTIPPRTKCHRIKLEREDILLCPKCAKKIAKPKVGYQVVG